MKKLIFTVVVLSLLLALAPAVLANGGTTVPGHRRWDEDNNGYPDEGVTINGHYTALFAYEGDYGPGDYPQENWYWDLGDGRIMGTVNSVDELDQDRLTVCDYVINHRGNFENDPFLDSGWIQNHINCYGYDDNNHYNYLIVHETDPRYRGNPDWAIWGTWEYHALTISGYGNLVRPMQYMGP